MTSIVLNRCILGTLFFSFWCFEFLSHCISVTVMLRMATAKLIMKCNASVREHSKLPVQHSCISAFMEDLRKCITLFKAWENTAIADAIRNYIVPLLGHIMFSIHWNRFIKHIMADFKSHTALIMLCWYPPGRESFGKPCIIVLSHYLL